MLIIMCDWGGGPYGATGYLMKLPSRDHHESDLEFEQRINVPVTKKKKNYCSNCGIKLETSWQHCPECGVKI